MDWFKKFMIALFPEKAADIEKVELPKEFATPPPEQKKTEIPAGNGSANEIQELKSMLQAVVAENKELKETLGELKTRSDSSVKAMEERANVEAKARREAVIAEAVKARKIPAKSDELHKHYLTLLESNFDAGKAVIDALPVIGAPAPGNQQPGNQGQGGQSQKPVNPILATILEKGNIVN